MQLITSAFVSLPEVGTSVSGTPLCWMLPQLHVGLIPFVVHEVALIEGLLAQAVLKCELDCHRAKAAAEGVGGPQDPQGVCPGSYVAVHLADVPAAVVLKLQQRVEESSQARAASLLKASPTGCGVLCLYMASKSSGAWIVNTVLCG